MELDGVIRGLHHVTATVNEAQEDYDFYTKLLGLRLVKETVNFDNEKVYHFYYGNEIGSPSTIFTTFPYGKEGVNKGVIGHGQVYQTSFNVPEGALPFWRRRLEEHGVDYAMIQQFGDDILEFEDPSGLRLDIREKDDDREHVWTSDELDESKAINGIYGVILLVKDAAETLPFLNLFGYNLRSTDGKLTMLEAGEGGPGNVLIVKSDPDAIEGVNGVGTVHHVAHRVENVEVTRKIKKFLEEEHDISVTEVKDRKYFESIYFRIPGNILFEVATEGPGFLVDEVCSELGSSLKLPEWQEVRREEIEENLEDYDR